MNSNNLVKELIVKCPYSGKDVNIAPILYTFQFFEGPKDMADSINRLIEDVIVHANVEMIEVLTEDNNHFYYVLTSLRRALACMEPAKYSIEDLRLVFGN